MEVERKFFTLISRLLVIIFLGVGCANKNSQVLSAIDQAEDLLNHQLFTQAINFITGELNTNPGNLELESLLANAYMGRAGFELLPTVNKLMGAQNTTPLGIYNEPTCDPSAVKSLTELSLTCFLYRLAKVLPAVDNPDVLQAQKIYRTYFPDPTNTSKEVNFAAGTLEAMSAVTRAVALLNLSVVNGIITGLTVNPYLFPFDPVIHQTKNGITEINWAFSRLRNSYSSLDNFVQSLNGKTVLTIGSRQLQFNNSITYPAILQFASLVLQDQSAIIDQQMSNSATDQFQMMTSGLSPIYRHQFLVLYTRLIRKQPVEPLRSVPGKLSGSPLYE